MGVNAQAKKRVDRLAYAIALGSDTGERGHVVQEVGGRACSALALRSLRRGEGRPLSSLGGGGRLGSFSSLHSLGDSLTQHALLPRYLSPLMHEGGSTGICAHDAEVASLVGDEPDICS